GGRDGRAPPRLGTTKDLLVPNWRSLRTPLVSSCTPTAAAGTRTMKNPTLAANDKIVPTTNATAPVTTLRSGTSPTTGSSHWRTSGATGVNRRYVTVELPTTASRSPTPIGSIKSAA